MAIPCALCCLNAERKMTSTFTLLHAEAERSLIEFCQEVVKRIGVFLENFALALRPLSWEAIEPSPRRRRHTAQPGVAQRTPGLVQQRVRTPKAFHRMRAQYVR